MGSDMASSGAAHAFQPEAGDRGALSPIQAVLLRKWSILVFALVAASAVAAFVRGLPNTYMSEVAVSIDGRQLRVINAESLMTKQMLDSEQLRTEMEPLTGIALARDVVRDLSLNTNPEFCGKLPEAARQDGTCSMPVDIAARRLMGQVTARTDGSSYVIYIGATAGTPVLAARIANDFARAFIAERRNAAYAVAAEAGTWLATYAEQLRQEVVKADAAVAAYESAQGLTPLHGGTLAAQTLVDMNASLTQLTGEIAERRSAVVQLQSAAHSGGNFSANSLVGQAPLLAQLLSRQAENAEQESRLRTMFGNSHPDVIAAEAQAARLQQQVAIEVGKVVRSASSDLASLESRRAAIETKVAALQAQIGTQGQADVQLQALQREADSKRQIYQSVLSRQMELQAQHGVEQADARVVAEALPPVAPNGPHRAMLVVGAFLAACGLGATLAVPLSMLSRRFRDADHIEDEIGLPVLGMFPRPPAGTAPHDIVYAQAGSPQAEAVLRILPNILRGLDDGKAGGKSVVVASALPGEGKTSFAIALARAANQLGVSTLLMDCDLRRPSVYRLLGAGASDTRNQAGSDSGPAIGDEPTILSLSSAMPDRSRFVSAQDVTVLLTKLTAEYDLVLLDAPPVLVLADAMTLATAADAAILVVDWRTTPRRAVLAAVQVLRRQGADLLGAVASKADLRKDAQASSHYFHYKSDYFTTADSRPQS
jgi:uncharacterized protein involved in exopolysaccharide biosynthesis